MLELAQQTKKINLDYYVINHQWFRMTYVILYNLQSTNSEILLTKASSGNLINDCEQKKERNKEKRFKTFLQAFTENFTKLRNLQNLNWPRPNQLGLTWNLNLAIFEIKLAFDQQNRKKIIKQEHSAFIVAYFSIYIMCCIE